MMKRANRALPLILLFLAAGASSARNAHAADQDEYVPRAFESLVTPAGLKRLEKDTVEPFLANLGIDFDQHELKTWDYRSSSEVSLEPILDEMLRFSASMKDGLSDLLNSWLNPPRPAAHVDQLWYEVNPSQLGLTLLGRGEQGWIEARFDASLEWFQAEAGRFSLVDEANTWLDEFALIEAALSSFSNGDPDSAFKFEVRFAFRLSPETRDFEIRIQSIDCNIASIPISFGLSDIVLPVIDISIGGGRSQGGRATVQLKEYALAHREELMNQLRQFIERYVRAKLPQVLNDELKTRWKDILAFIVEFSPPGMDNDHVSDSAEAFEFGYRPLELDFDPSSREVRASWDVKVTDRLFPERSSPSSRFSDRGHADFAPLGPTTSYDIGLSVNPELITHAVDLSLRNRNLFPKTPMDQDSRHPDFFRLISKPVFTDVVVTRKYGPVLKARMTLGVTLHGLNGKLFKNREAVLEVEALMSIRAGTGENQDTVEFLLVGLDVAGSRLVPESIAAVNMASLIRSVTQGMLKSQSKEYEKTPSLLFRYPLAPTYLGIRVQLKKTALDSNGHILIALDQVVGRSKKSTFHGIPIAGVIPGTQGDFQ